MATFQDGEELALGSDESRTTIHQLHQQIQ